MNDNFEDEMLEEMIYNVPRNRLQNETRANTQRNRQTSSEENNDIVFRLQLYETIFNYNNNIRAYSETMQAYQENISQFLQIMNSNRQSSRPRNISRPTTVFEQTRQPSFGTPNPYTPPARQSNYLARTRPNPLFANTTIDNIFSFSDVVVRPSEAQIANATRYFTYSTDTDSSLADTSFNNTRCPITLEDFQEGEDVCEIRHCRHLFKKQSILDWFTRNVRCPVCRYDIREYVENTATRNQSASVANARRPRPTGDQAYNSIVNNLTDGITTILQNYMDMNSFDSSMNNILTFEIPLMYYREVQDSSMNVDIDVD